MEGKICTRCNVEKNIEDFHNKYTEWKTCNSNRSLKLYYEIKDKLSNERQIFFEKNRDVLLAKCKVSQQNKKTFKQQLEELNKKLGRRINTSY